MNTYKQELNDLLNQSLKLLILFNDMQNNRFLNLEQEKRAQIIKNNLRSASKQLEGWRDSLKLSDYEHPFNK